MTVVFPLYELYREIRKRYKNVYFVEVPLRPTNEEKKRLLKYINEASRKVDKIVVGIFNKHHAEIVTRLNKDIKIVHLCVKSIPHSGKKDELLAHYNLDSNAIASAVVALVNEEEKQKRENKEAEAEKPKVKKKAKLKKRI